MPTTIPSGEKNAFIAIVNAVNPQEALRLATVMVFYEGIPEVIGRQQDAYAANLAYLTECMNTLNNTALLTAGVYYSQTTNTPAVNPLIWINSTALGNISITVNTPGLAIYGKSSVNAIVLAASVQLQHLYIAPGSTVDKLDSTATGAAVNNVYIDFARSTPGSLNVVRFGSTVGNIQVTPGGYYGGVEAVDPANVCNNPVTGMNAMEPTKNSVLIQWTPPASGFTTIDVFFRKSNSKPWILATQEDGDFVDYTGFVFRNLETDTFYDFRASVVCNNGGISDMVITTQTVCCGANTQLGLYKFCQIVMLILASPNPANMQVLSNGVSIPKEYPVGTTITVPYLASVNSRIVSDMVIDNLPFQLMPYNSGTGTWDASGTSVLGFNDGSTVTVGMAIPA